MQRGTRGKERTEFTFLTQNTHILRTDQWGLAVGSKEGERAQIFWWPVKWRKSSDPEETGCDQPTGRRLSITDREKSFCCRIHGKPIELNESFHLCMRRMSLEGFQGAGYSNCLWGSNVGGRFLFHGILICTVWIIYCICFTFSKLSKASCFF